MSIIIGIGLIVLALLAGHVLFASAKETEHPMKRWLNYVSASALMVMSIFFIAQHFLGITAEIV